MELHDRLSRRQVPGPPTPGLCRPSRGRPGVPGLLSAEFAAAALLPDEQGMRRPLIARSHWPRRPGPRRPRRLAFCFVRGHHTKPPSSPRCLCSQVDAAVLCIAMDARLELRAPPSSASPVISVAPGPAAPCQASPLPRPPPSTPCRIRQVPVAASPGSPLLRACAAVPCIPQPAVSALSGSSETRSAEPQAPAPQASSAGKPCLRRRAKSLCCCEPPLLHLSSARTKLARRSTGSCSR